jgi:hypothetical protein
MQLAEPLPFLQGNPFDTSDTALGTIQGENIVPLQLASAQRDIVTIAWDVQVDVAGGGTVTYVDDMLFPLAKVRVVQQHHYVPRACRPPPFDA